MRVKSPEGRAGGAEPGAWETRGQLHFGVVPSTVGPCHSCLVLSLTGRVLLSVAVWKAGAEPTPSLRPSPGGLHRRPGWGGPPCWGSGPSLGGLQSSRDSARAWHNWGFPSCCSRLGPSREGSRPAHRPGPRPQTQSLLRISRPEAPPLPGTHTADARQQTPHPGDTFRPSPRRAPTLFLLSPPWVGRLRQGRHAPWNLSLHFRVPSRASGRSGPGLSVTDGCCLSSGTQQSLSTSRKGGFFSRHSWGPTLGKMGPIILFDYSIGALGSQCMVKTQNLPLGAPVWGRSRQTAESSLLVPCCRSLVRQLSRSLPHCPICFFPLPGTQLAGDISWTGSHVVM